jgi:hypothetical protein
MLNLEELFWDVDSSHMTSRGAKGGRNGGSVPKTYVVLYSYHLCCYSRNALCGRKPKLAQRRTYGPAACWPYSIPLIMASRRAGEIYAYG